MVSVSNPNKPSKNRLAARAAKGKKVQQKSSAEGKLSRVEKAATKRGARPGLLPTSGPGAKLSSKKARKLERKMAHAMKRKMEADGEVEMKGRFLNTPVLSLGRVCLALLLTGFFSPTCRCHGEEDYQVQGRRADDRGDGG